MPNDNIYGIYHIEPSSVAQLSEIPTTFKPWIEFSEP